MTGSRIKSGTTAKKKYQGLGRQNEEVYDLKPQGDVNKNIRTIRRE